MRCAHNKFYDNIDNQLQLTMESPDRLSNRTIIFRPPYNSTHLFQPNNITFRKKQACQRNK